MRMCRSAGTSAEIEEKQMRWLQFCLTKLLVAMTFGLLWVAIKVHAFGLRSEAELPKGLAQRCWALAVRTAPADIRPRMIAAFSQLNRPQRRTK